MLDIVPESSKTADPAAVGHSTALAAGDPPDSILAPLEIVHVVRQYAPAIGGLEEFVAKLAAKQRSTFGRVRVVTVDRTFSGPETVLPEFELIDGIEVQRLPYRGSKRYPVMKGLMRAVSSADILHVHAVDYAFDMLALTRRLHTKPLVATTHGGFFHTNAYATLKKVWFNTLTRTSVRGYDAVICCSESDLASFRPIAGDRAQLILNGVDIEKFADAGARRLTRNLVTLGRFSSNKRLDRLIGVMALLAADNPAWHLDICGVPGDVSVAELEKLIADRALQDRITLHVGLPVDRLREIIGHASYFVSASEYEGFGLALIEAMSAGLLPVVHANAAFEAFAAAHLGVVTCDYGHPDDVVRRLLDLYEMAGTDLPALRDQAMHAASGYGWDRMKVEYDRAYVAALSAR